MDINYLLVPPRYKRFRKELSDKPFKLLDVGSSNGSSLLAKHWFPACIYHGLDISGANLSSAELAAMDKFVECDLENGDLSALNDGFYDVVVFAHVIEHLTNGLEVLAALTRKLAPGGRIYVEFPSVRSLSLPSAQNTLNFCDDPTHIRVYDIKEVANTLLAQRLRVVRAGARREWARILLSPLTLPKQIASLLKDGRLSANGLWDLMGFADFVYARRG
ncbi:MAG: methyltransferase domain-containing protein [Alphaproteobacteria bacterium]